MLLQQISSKKPLGLKNNYQLKAAKLQRDAAQASARSTASNHLPQIDLVGRVSKSTSKQGKFGGFIQNPLFGVEQDTRQYSIQFNLPLYAGGAISSARRQAYANYDRSKEQAIYAERSTVRDVRSNHFGVQTQVANVTASAATVTFAHFDATANTTTELLKDFELPGNDASGVITGKFVVQEGNSIVASASANNTLKITLSVLESVNA